MRLLLSVALSLPCLAEPVYTGKYADTEEFKRLAEALPEMKKAAVKTIGEKLGLTDIRTDNIVVVFADMKNAASRDIQAAGTGTRKVGDDVEQVITVNLEVHFGGQESLEVELLHEMTHAVMRNHLGDEKHRKLPKWAREGLALWVAEQGEGRAANWLSNVGHEVDPVGALLNGLENADHQLRDYPEDYFAVVAMIELGGEGAVPAFVAKLAEGSACREAAAAAARVSWEEFEERAHAVAAKRLEEMAPAEMRNAYRRATALYRKEDLEGARKAFEAIEKEHGGTWAGALAIYYVGRCRMKGGDPKGAAEKLREFLEGPAKMTGLKDDAVYHLGGCLEATGEHEEAVRQFDRLARDFPFNSEAALASLKAAVLTQEKLERREEAVKRYESIVKSWPGTPAAKEAGFRLQNLKEK